MRRILFLLITILAVGSLVFAHMPGDETSPWERLKDSKILTNLKIYDSPPSTDPVRPLRIDMSPIRQELERVGIRETVKIELRTRSHKMLARLGKYKPVFEKDGEKGVFFDSIPDVKEFYITSKRSEVESKYFKERDGEGTQFPEKGVLYIKGKKKNQVKLVVTYTRLHKVI